MKNLFVLCLIFFVLSKTDAQYIINGTDTLFGNEWIEYDQTYFKIKLAQDGIYRVTGQALQNAGVPINELSGDRFQLWHNAVQIPIFTTTSGVFSGTDYFEFFGRKNTSELDRYLFQNPDSTMMNPLYSMFSDTAAYFLTWSPSSNNPRYSSIANNLSNLPPREEYYIASQVLNITNKARKEADINAISFSNFTNAEGFASEFANVSNFTLSPTAIYSSGPDAVLKLRFTGNAVQHQQAISLNNSPIFTSVFSLNEVQQESLVVPVAQLTASTIVKFQGMASSTDNHRVSNIILDYPRSFDFENKKSYQFIVASSTTVRYIEISNFDATDGLPILYDITNGLRIECSYENGLVKVALPPSNTNSELLLVNTAGGSFDVVNLIPTIFIDYKSLDHDYVILTSKRLNKLQDGINQVQEYANYRASMAGGAFNPLIVEVEELYDQFSWGIERHPFSIRNFAHYIKENWSEPKYFFIVGKGWEYPDLRSSTALSNGLNNGFSVPTYSFPGSDNLLLAGTDGYTPIIPIGRIAVKSQADLKTYLDKVKEFEGTGDLPQTIEDRTWMKRVLHMGGGLTQGEQSSIKFYLNSMEGIIENSSFGAEVRSFYKTSSDPIQVSQTDLIFQYINYGTSIISFFGHSGVGTFDFSIDNPDNFNNKGKYPLILSLGCYSGNIHTMNEGLSERFCFFKDKGAIAFGATAGQGYVTPLSIFASKFYENLGSEYYGAGIGEMIQKAIKSQPANDGGLNLIRQQFNLHGDPALKINPMPGPDFVVDGGTIKISPDNITTQMEEFEVEFDVVNLGKGVSDSIFVKVERELPDGTNLLIEDRWMPSPRNREKFKLIVPVLGRSAYGFNKLRIVVDNGNLVEELPQPPAELNNELSIAGGEGFSFFVNDNNVVCAYPTDFSIIGNTVDFELSASTTDPLTPERAYVFQIDTTELFNSPLLITHKIIQSGGVLKWKPIMDWQNETVYYWRVSPDSTAQQKEYVWDNSSFVYLQGSDGGWNQSHFYQWRKDEFEDMELKTHGNLKFIENYKDVFIRNAVNSLNPLTSLELQINNTYRGRIYGTPPGMYVTVFDSLSTKEWVNVQPSQYGLLNPNNHEIPIYLFSTQDLASRTQLIQFLKDVVPSKNYVFVYTTQLSPGSNYKPQEWPNDTTALGIDLFQILEEQGANLIRNTVTKGSLPYIFAYQKDVGPLTEELADSIKQVLRVNVSLPGYWDRGALTSIPIGPVGKWEKLIWDIEDAASPASDTFSVDVLSYNPNTLTDSIIFKNLQPGEHDLSSLSALDFPYLKLRFNAEDSLERTSPQPNHWRILYKGVPDFALNPNGGYVFDNDNLQQGEPFWFKCLVENLSDFAGTDSLLVKYALRSTSNNELVLLEKERTMTAHDTLFAEIQLADAALSGNYTFMLELNPEDKQPESTRANNVLFSNIKFGKDERNPLLDVTFDGQRILDGDLVSAKPNILISLKDENPYLALNDTSLFKLFLVYPDSENVLRRIYFNDPQLLFHPALGTNNNKATIELRPIFILDGDYKLIVQARDVSGNQSGQFDYKVAFKIITKSAISNFLNYPNPFTTSTRFVYTMTGAEPPARYKMQIMTNSGRIVRELTQDELGPLRVGTHQTDFAWDGTDEFGDKLANGVYLYRMLVQDANNKEWDSFENGTDKYFGKGFGKMVLLR